MPSVGMPSAKTSGSTCGAPSAYTDAGPPLRISACGLRALTCAAVTPWPTSSEYTRHSRTRRAISCAYWPPRSTTRTGRSSAGRSGSARTSAAIVRCLLRDRHVVRMAFAQPRRRDAHEARGLQILNLRRAAITHRLAKPADELVQDARDRPLVGNAALDPFRHELLDVLDVALEVAVARGTTRAHRAERAHAAVLLVALTLVEHDVARALVSAREQRARHDGVGAGRDRLGNVARRRHAAVGDQRYAVPGGNRRAVVDRGDLRHAHTGNDPRCADRTWAYANLHRVGSGVDQRLRRLGRRNVAGNDLDVEFGLDAPDHLRHRGRMPVRGIDDENVDAGIDERAGALPGIVAHAHGGTHAQATLLILCRFRELDPLLDVLHRDQPRQPSLGVDDRKLLDLVAVQDCLRLGERRSLGRGDEVA